eukprot:GEZU01026233.1.p1 GENE.GEZU01026233.1~~GEZU01026233.1.p1  ORF type:complete len:280 (-),score=17.43 GEZU01026233.1:55-894(-)
MTQIQIIHKDFGLYVWPSALCLAQYIWKYRDFFKGRSILELGAGTSLPGLLCAKIGAKWVYLSDRETETRVFENCDVECALNNVAHITQTLGLTWGDISTEFPWAREDATYSDPSVEITRSPADSNHSRVGSTFAPPPPPPPEVIIAADCFYDTKDFDNIFATVSYLFDEYRYWCKNTDDTPTRAASSHEDLCSGPIFITTYHERSENRSIEFFLRKWGMTALEVPLSSFFSLDDISVLTVTSRGVDKSREDSDENNVDSVAELPINIETSVKLFIIKP